MTRIVGGVAGGRRLKVPAGDGTRPTSERAREGLFSTVGSLLPLDGVAVLDLFAGSGALGLEALSRGARSVVAVEHHRTALVVLRANVAAVGLPGVTIVAMAVERFLGADAGPGEQVDLVLADPPYALAGDMLTALLVRLVDGGRLAPGAVVAVERATRSGAVDWPAGIEPERDRRYGDTTLWYGRRP